MVRQTNVVWIVYICFKVFLNKNKKQFLNQDARLSSFCLISKDKMFRPRYTNNECSVSDLWELGFHRSEVLGTSPLDSLVCNFHILERRDSIRFAKIQLIINFVIKGIKSFIASASTPPKCSIYHYLFSSICPFLFGNTSHILTFQSCRFSDPKPCSHCSQYWTLSSCTSFQNGRKSFCCLNFSKLKTYLSGSSIPSFSLTIDIT